MRIFHHYQQVPRHNGRRIVALGNFDGVHRGHQAIVARALSFASDMPDAEAWVMTFAPHPRRFFAPTEPSFLLTPPPIRQTALEKLGVSFLLEQVFDAHFAQMEAADFVRLVLVDTLQASHVVVGEDYAFGRGRSGTVSVLQELGAQLGFSVEVVPLVRIKLDPEGIEHVCSSSLVRTALQDGKPKRAADLLGRFWQINGIVSHGQHRGATIGFPTANINLGDYLHPAFGVYALRASLAENPAQEWSAVGNIGTRPTFNDDLPLAEIHLLDFNGDLYGKDLCISLVSHIRPVQKFSGIEALRQQIIADVVAARTSLAATTALFPSSDVIRPRSS